MADISKAQEARANKILDTYISYRDQNDYRVSTTRRVFVENLMLKQNGRLKTWEENRVKNMSARTFFRATNEEQEEHARRQREAGKKTCYGIEFGYSSFYEVTKMEYDYAASLIGSASRIA